MRRAGLGKFSVFIYSCPHGVVVMLYNPLAEEQFKDLITVSSAKDSVTSDWTNILQFL